MLDLFSTLRMKGLIRENSLKFQVNFGEELWGMVARFCF